MSRYRVTTKAMFGLIRSQSTFKSKRAAENFRKRLLKSFYPREVRITRVK